MHEAAGIKARPRVGARHEAVDTLPDRRLLRSAAHRAAPDSDPRAPADLLQRAGIPGPAVPG